MTLRRKVPFLVAFAILAVVGMSVSQTACWPFGGSSSGVTSTTQPAGKVTSTTAATTGTAPAATAAHEAAQYASDLNSWMAKYWDNADKGAFSFKKPTAPTAKEIQRAQALVDQQLASIGALKLIKAPAALTTTHAQYVAAIAGEAKAAQRVLTAARNRNWRDVELAMRAMNQARALEVASMGAMEDYMAQHQDPATAPVEEGDHMIFSDSKVGFSVQYPKAWKTLPSALYTDRESPAEVTLAITDGSGSIESRALNFMEVEADHWNSKTGESPRKLMDQDLADLSAAVTAADQLKIIQPNHDLKVNGLPAAEIVASFVLQGKAIKTRECRVCTGQAMITFTIVAEEKDWDKANAVFEAVMKSLQGKAAA